MQSYTFEYTVSYSAKGLAELLISQISISISNRKLFHYLKHITEVSFF